MLWLHSKAVITVYFTNSIFQYKTAKQLWFSIVLISFLYIHRDKVNIFEIQIFTKEIFNNYHIHDNIWYILYIHIFVILHFLQQSFSTIHFSHPHLFLTSLLHKVFPISINPHTSVALLIYFTLFQIASTFHSKLSWHPILFYLWETMFL